MLEAVLRLVEAIINAVGPGWTFGYIITGFTLLFLNRLYQNHRRDKWANRAIEEKERTIQRLAQQDREWRIYWMVVSGGITRREAEKIVQENRYFTPEEARSALESGENKAKKGLSKKQKK